MKRIFILLALTLVLASSFALQASVQDKPYYSADYRLTPQDDLAIRQVIARLNHSLDAVDYKAYSAHFSADAVFATTFGNAIGPEAIAAALEQSRPYITNKRHIPSNIILNGNGKRIQIVMYLTVFERTASLSYVGSAVTTAIAEKRNGKWLMVNYKTELDPATLAAMKAVMSQDKK